MQYLRIATYRQTAGTFEEVSRLLRAPGGLADVFRASPGFVSYAFADLGDGTNVSISMWSTAEAADGATAAARTWVAANIAELGTLIDDRSGPVGFAIGEFAAGAV